MKLAILLAGLSLCNPLLQFVQLVLTIARLGPATLATAPRAATVFLFLALPHAGVRSAGWVPAITAAVQVLLLLSVLGRPRSPGWGSVAMTEAGPGLKPLLLGTTYYKSDPRNIEAC